MEESSKIIVGIRETLYHIFRGLPLTLVTAITLLGAFQGNINWIIFAVGLGILAPLGVLAVNTGLEFLIPLLGRFIDTTSITDLVYMPQASVCTLMDILPTGNAKPAIVVPTYWTTLTVFFFAYLILNANDLYTRKTPKSADKVGVNARKSRMLMSIAMLSIFGALSLIVRFAVTHCENALGMLTGISLGGGLAYGWYTFVRNCGIGHFDDIFGVSARLLSKEAAGLVSPKVCVPSK
jgi:hypothetical protein